LGTASKAHGSGLKFFIFSGLELKLRPWLWWLLPCYYEYFCDRTAKTGNHAWEVHNFSGHIACLTYCLLTLKPVLKVILSTLNLQATANLWYDLVVGLNIILSPQDQASIQ